jgi:ADP-ribose pyrophosphatase YjhB (NUDIX family)
MDTVTKYAKNYVWLVCTKLIDGQNHFLIYTRQVQPFLGCQGFPAGKIDWGETITSAASRELMEETGLAGNPKVKAIIHFIFDKGTPEVIQDEFLYVVHYAEPTGNLISSEEGENNWIPETELLGTLKKPFVPLQYYSELIELTKDTTDEVKLLEYKSTTQDF